MEMEEDTSATPPSSTKRPCDQGGNSQGSPKRVKVDLPPTSDANPHASSADIPQSSKKSQKRRDAAGYPKSRQGKEKNNRNVGRRRRDATETNEAGTGTSEVVDPKDAPEKAPRLPKRQSAILLGFCGTGCAGMQMSVSRYHRFRERPSL